MPKPKKTPAKKWKTLFFFRNFFSFNKKNKKVKEKNPIGSKKKGGKINEDSIPVIKNLNIIIKLRNLNYL